MEISDESKLLIIHKNIQDLPTDDISKIYDMIQERKSQKSDKIIGSPKKQIPNKTAKKIVKVVKTSNPKLDETKVVKSVKNVKTVKKVKTPESSEDNNTDDMDNESSEGNDTDNMNNKNNPTNNESSKTSVVIAQDSTIDDVMEQLKCNLIFKYINNMLKNNGKPELKKLEDFVDVDREDLIGEANTEYAKNTTKELSKVFDKKKCKFIYPVMKKGTHISILRNLVKNTKSYNFFAKNIDFFEGKTRHSATLYTIKKNI